MSEAQPSDPPACRRVSSEVWAEVREAYVSGLSAPACCRRFGVGLSALRQRAAGEGWRRADMPWTPPAIHLDPEDEGVKLEEDISGDLDMLHPFMLSRVAERRMMRAVLRGDATEVMRWHRVYRAMETLQLEEDREHAYEDAMRARLFPDGAPDPDDPDELDELDDLDGVFPPPGT